MYAILHVSNHQARGSVPMIKVRAFGPYYTKDSAERDFPSGRADREEWEIVRLEDQVGNIADLTEEVQP